MQLANAWRTNKELIEMTYTSSTLDTDEQTYVQGSNLVMASGDAAATYDRTEFEKLVLKEVLDRLAALEAAVYALQNPPNLRKPIVRKKN